MIAYRDTGVALFEAQLQGAVQVDFTVCPSELEHVEREDVGRSLSVSFHLHRLVGRVRTSAQKKESRRDDTRSFKATSHTFECFLTH